MKRTNWILILTLLLVATAYAVDRRVKGVARVAAVTPAECSICCGDNLDLCAINNTPDGLILEFGRPVSSAYFSLTGAGAQVDVWLRREDIGTGRFQTFLPYEGDDEMARGISFDPPYVAVRLTGRTVAIKDIVYGD